ncbi:RsmB/NOP family class I SAM-dependent RNA methyltransferase [Haliangium sp.]|uniref:RsmB/NOP family class I SAM-dependent RNA methyltransferase n=1 Tax=Haliangium sp. TaxID=2663208 RepID=UPI003D0F2E8F
MRPPASTETGAATAADADRRAWLEATYGRYRELVDDWRGFLDALCAPHVTCVWAHPLRPPATELARILSEAGRFTPEPIVWAPGAFRLRGARGPGDHWAYRAGLYQVQEEASLVPAALLAAAPGERVLDLCAAPGNKTAQLALALGSRGTVVANDRNASRLPAIQNVIDRLGLCNVTITCHDGATYPLAAGPFDKVLVDAPCSAEGTARKLSPGRAVDEHFRSSIRGVQRALLRRALALTRPGGRVVYSTCTFAPEENELVIDAVLRAQPDAARLCPARIDGFAGGPGITTWHGHALSPDLDRCLRVWPHLSDTDGFFAAVLERGDAPVLAEQEDRTAPDPTRGAATDPLADAIPATLHPRIAALCERHEIPPEAFDDLVALRRGRYLRLLSADHEPPRGLSPRAFGLPAVSAKSSQPRLSTAGALAFGAAARRDRVSLDPTQTRAYHAGASVALAATRHADHGPGGYVVVCRRDGPPLGAGLLRGRAPELVLESQYPTAWRRV